MRRRPLSLTVLWPLALRYWRMPVIVLTPGIHTELVFGGKFGLHPLVKSNFASFSLFISLLSFTSRFKVQSPFAGEISVHLISYGGPLQIATYLGQRDTSCASAVFAGCQTIMEELEIQRCPSTTRIFEYGLFFYLLLF